MTDLEALRILFTFNPLGRDGVSRRVADYLDGRSDELPPTIKQRIDEAVEVINPPEGSE